MDPRLSSVKMYRFSYLAERITQKAAEQSAARQKGHPLRLSNAGSCARKLAMQRINWEARERGECERFSEEALQPRALLVFHLGDLVEESVKHWIQGCGLLWGQSGAEVRIPLVVAGKTHWIPGHLDGLVQEPGQAMMLVVLEIKSINPKGFDRLEAEGPDYGYACQVMAYMRSLGLTRARILYMNKGTSHLDEWVIEFSEELMAQVEERFRKVIRATPEALPDREYTAETETEFVRGLKNLVGGVTLREDGTEWDTAGKRIVLRKRNGYWRETGRKILGWNCSYCPLKGPCWGESLQADLSGNSPTWYINGAAQ